VLPTLSVAGARVFPHAPFPPPAHRTGQADLPHPALRRASLTSTRGRPAAPTSPASTALSTTSEPLTGLLDLTVNPQALVASIARPKSGPFPPRALPRLDGTMDLSDSPSSPACPSRAPGWVTHPPPGVSRVAHFPYADMPSPLPRRDRWWDRVAPRKPATAAFPVGQLGRLPHWPFRGLLGVHCTLRPACSRSHLKRPFTPKASAVSLPPLPLRLLLAGATVTRWD
jgi:hypothetical protein